MTKPSTLTSLLLILCSLSLALAFTPTLKASYFYLPQVNWLNSELDQTRNGIIGFSIEAANEDYTSDQTVSQYILIDIPNRDAKAILTDLVSACEDINVTPVFKRLHYHANTDTLAYFCYANNSLLLLDQSSYTVKQAIPLSISGKWPIAKLSTEGMGITILLMGDFITSTTSQASLLVKVDLQARAVTAQISLNQGFAAGETVVAYASGKKGAFIATNKIKGDNIATTVYSFITIGKTYQITSLKSFTTPVQYVKTITKLFCLGNFVAVNNGQDLYFLNQQGGINTQVKGLDFRSSNCKSTNFYDLAMIAQSESTDLYLMANTEAVYKYSVLADGIHSTKLGDFADIKIAYGNSISGDKMLSLNTNSDKLTIYDIKTMTPVYFSQVGFNDHMLTDTTYVIRDLDAWIFDLKSGNLIATPRAAGDIYYTKEQNIISQWLRDTMSTCSLWHIDIITGKTWKTYTNIYSWQDCGRFTKVRITENGTPEMMIDQNLDEYLIVTENYGTLHFKTEGDNRKRGVNLDFDNLSFYMLNSSTDLNQTNITSYVFNPQSQNFEVRDINTLDKVSGEAFAYINTTHTVIVSDNTAVILNGVGRNPEKYSFPQNWNSASSFQDPSGNNYIILTRYDSTFFKASSVPGLLVNGKITDLPGTRKESTRAQAAGVNSYWVFDHLRSSFGAVRIYSVDSSKKAEEKISI